jgi:hypothetical protein
MSQAMPLNSEENKHAQVNPVSQQVVPVQQGLFDKLKSFLSSLMSASGVDVLGYHLPYWLLVVLVLTLLYVSCRMCWLTTFPCPVCPVRGAGADSSPFESLLQTPTVIRNLISGKTA